MTPSAVDAPSSPSSWHDDGLLAASVATAAGRVLLQVRDELATADPAVLRTAGDRRSHEYIVGALQNARPNDLILSEEAPDDPARVSAERVWIVDPLDGTREFGEPGRSDWAVHVALSWRGGAACAAVALPALDLTMASHPAVAAPPRRTGTLRLVVSRTRAPAMIQALAEELGADVLPMGSAGAKAGAVLRGDADAYVHAGGQYEWDVAAPAIVASAAGFHASRLDGSSLRFNKPEPWSPDLLVCRPELAERILALVASLC